MKKVKVKAAITSVNGNYNDSVVKCLMKEIMQNGVQVPAKFSLHINHNNYIIM